MREEEREEGGGEGGEGGRNPQSKDHISSMRSWNYKRRPQDRSEAIDDD